MDSPPTRRAAIGRALNAREPLSTDAFLTLTEEERLHGLALFSNENGTPDEPHETFERAVAPVAPVAPAARIFRPVVRPFVLETWVTPVWQARILGTMLTAAAAGFAAASVRMIEAPSGTRAVVSSARPVVPSAPVAAGPRPVVVGLVNDAPASEPPVGDAPISPDDVTQAVVTKAVVPPEAAAQPAPPPPPPAPAPAPRRVALPARPQPEPQATRPEPAVRMAVASSPVAAEPRPAVDAVVALIVPRSVAAAPAAPPRIEASAAPVRVPAPESAIQTVLSRYRTAYGDLDVGAAQAVWPSADTKALRKAFDRLEEQELVFDTCSVSVSDARALAVCSGTASYVPRVGKKARRGDQRQWEFELSKAGDGWLIDSVSAR